MIHFVTAMLRPDPATHPPLSVVMRVAELARMPIVVVHPAAYFYETTQLACFCRRCLS